MHFKARAHPPPTHQHMIWNRLMRWSQYHSSNCQTQCLAKSNHTSHTVPIFLTCWLWSMAGAKLQRTEIVRTNYPRIQNINTIQIQIQKYKFQQRVGGHPQMGSSAYGLERNIGGKISTKTNIQIQRYKFEEKDGGHPQLGASANGLEEGGGSNPPVMNILYLLVNSAYNQTEEEYMHVYRL